MSYISFSKLFLFLLANIIKKTYEPTIDVLFFVAKSLVGLKRLKSKHNVPGTLCIERCALLKKGCCLTENVYLCAVKMSNLIRETMAKHSSCIKKVFAYEIQNNNIKRVIFNTIHWVDFW